MPIVHGVFKTLRIERKSLEIYTPILISFFTFSLILNSVKDFCSKRKILKSTGSNLFSWVSVPVYMEFSC